MEFETWSEQWFKTWTQNLDNQDTKLEHQPAMKTQSSTNENTQCIAKLSNIIHLQFPFDLQPLSSISLTQVVPHALQPHRLTVINSMEFDQLYGGGQTHLWIQQLMSIVIQQLASSQQTSVTLTYYFE